MGDREGTYITWGHPSVQLRTTSPWYYDAHANVRIQCILTELIGFDMTLYWTQGIMNIVADALSLARARDKRYPGLHRQRGRSPRNQGG